MKSLILCEGKNDKDFLINLINHLSIDIFLIDIEMMKNKSNFFKIENYKTIKQKINLLYKKVLFIIDADYVENDKIYGGYSNTKIEIEKIINELNISNKTDIYIMCNPSTNNGYLESFLLSTIKEEQKKCINDFIECSNYKNRENHKAIINQIYKIGYPDETFDFTHSNFDDLKNKLFNLIKDQNADIRKTNRL